jgi:DNA-binding transcriptional ArsR family regulator
MTPDGMLGLGQDAPDPAKLFSLLDNDGVRAVLSALGDAPSTAGELADRCEIPQSSLYRYLGELAETHLVSESVRLDPNGKHSAEYSLAVNDLAISISPEFGFDVTFH